MSQQLDRSIRAYVARGTGLATNLVRPGNAKGQRPKEAYATLLPGPDVRTGAPQYRQTRDGDGVANGTRAETPRRRTYSLQFYRDGALDLANAFETWAASEDGLVVASTAFASYNGSIRRIALRDGGSYTAAPAVTISDLSGGGSGATATATLSPGTGMRSVASIGLDDPGRDYVSPAVSMPGDATAIAVGWGFHVEHPLTVRRLDDILGDAYEERAVIDLPILYTALDAQATGGVDSWDCEIIDGGSGETLTG